MRSILFVAINNLAASSSIHCTVCVDCRTTLGPWPGWCTNYMMYSVESPMALVSWLGSCTMYTVLNSLWHWCHDQDPVQCTQCTVLNSLGHWCHDQDPVQAIHCIVLNDIGAMTMILYNVHSTQCLTPCNIGVMTRILESYTPYSIKQCLLWVPYLDIYNCMRLTIPYGRGTKSTDFSRWNATYHR